MSDTDNKRISVSKSYCHSVCILFKLLFLQSHNIYLYVCIGTVVITVVVVSSHSFAHTLNIQSKPTGKYENHKQKETEEQKKKKKILFSFDDNHCTVEQKKKIHGDWKATKQSIELNALGIARSSNTIKKRTIKRRKE